MYNKIESLSHCTPDCIRYPFKKHRLTHTQIYLEREKEREGWLYFLRDKMVVSLSLLLLLVSSYAQPELLHQYAELTQTSTAYPEKTGGPQGHRKKINI